MRTKEDVILSKSPLPTLDGSAFGACVFVVFIDRDDEKIVSFPKLLEAPLKPVSTLPCEFDGLYVSAGIYLKLDASFPALLSLYPKPCLNEFVVELP